MYYTYMLRCSDNSIYTGITTDIERRMSEHFGQSGPAAKYTKSRSPSRLECAWSSENRSQASKLEARIKRLGKNDKERLIADRSMLAELLGEVLDCSGYYEIDIFEFDKFL